MELRSREILFFALTILFVIRSSTSSTPTLIPKEDLYEVRDGSYWAERRIDEKGDHWTRQANLDRLEVLANDAVLNLTFRSCIEDKSTEQNQYADDAGQNSKFEDVHQKAGFHHVHRMSGALSPHCVFDKVIPQVNSSNKVRIPGEYCAPEHATGGAAVGDYDGDGMEDIYFTVFHDRSVLYKNNGDGTFTDVTKDVNIGPSSLANGAVWADFDQDGDLDLYVTTVGDTRHYLYINYGGRFREEAMQRNCSMQTSDKRKLSGMTPNVGDFDLDGFVDIYVTEWIPHSLGKPSVSKLLRNRGHDSPGYFVDVTINAGVNLDDSYNGSMLNQGTYTYDSSFTDFDNDGFPELLVTAAFGGSKMFWNTQKSNFTECTISCGLSGLRNAIGHATGDWDNDGYLDWFSSAMWKNQSECTMSGCTFVTSGNSLYRNLGGRQFEDATNQAGVENGGMAWGAAFMDFNNDGFLDFISTSGNEFNKMHLWQNLGTGQNGKTQEVTAFYGLNGTGKGRGLVKWDYDDDGDEDIIVCNNVGAPFFYQYQRKEPNNWIRTRVVHRCLKNSNKLCDSVGARVQVIMGNNHTQTQQIGSSTHFLGQSSVVAHFGLGSNSGNVTVKVTWPSNLMVTYVNVTPNTRLRVVQPNSSDSGQTFQYSSLDKCFSLQVTSIVKQPSKSTVTVNPDGKTVKFQVNSGESHAQLGNQSFTYTVGLMPSPGGQPLTANSTAKVEFTSSALSGCQDGRMIGAVPTVTDDRRLEGTSNNKVHVRWGAAQEDLIRDAPPMYADGIVMAAGANRPSPRKISNELFQQVESKISARRLSDFSPNFGQFLAHDTDSSGTLTSRDFEVESDVLLPIEVPQGDIHFDRQNKGNVYLPFVRTTFNRCTGRGTSIPRQQVNKLTSYIDGSVVYGETEERSRALRSFINGKLKVIPDDLLPENNEALPNDNPVGRVASLLFVAGDSRANEQPGLIAFHTLFVREHNRLCDEYKSTNPQATDEQIFQAARRLVAAEIQAMTFREYLPSLLGGTTHIPPYQGYNDTINVGMSNMMSTAAFRFGHSQVNTHLWRYEEDGTMSPYGHVSLRDVFFSPERVKREGGLDPLFRGAVRQAAQEVDLKMVDDMRNVLFPSGSGLGSDLASKNIQRGRDHGLPDYNTVRKALGLKGLTSFSEITKDSEVASTMKDLYQDINNVDLWVGGLAEDHEDGSELGPTFRTIMMLNFLRIRDGDRFWYERYLSKEEIDKVNSMTLGKLIRMNTGFKSAPDNVFFSTQYCAGVKDFQCVPKTEIPSVTEATSNATRNALIVITVVMFVLVVSLVAVLVWLLYRSRQKRKIIPVKPAPGN
ncbi:uncharacterized protein [Porites lutea]|uniref:uncharacterized protein n=1 Tax=Porites lutea TaxID=51062 RepID=UPI003CC5C1F0